MTAINTFGDNRLSMLMALARGKRWRPRFDLQRRVLMPWTNSYCPASIKNLAPAVREKAIEIANALLAEGMEEGMAIRVAISEAKQWARVHLDEL